MDLPELRIEVERARHETVELKFEIPAASLELTDDPEFEFPGPVKGHLKAHMIGGESVHVRGEIATEARATCVRCLEVVPFPLKAAIDLMFFPEPSAFDRKRFAELEEDEKLYYAGDFLHPGDQLREELLLNLPFLPSCELQPGDICAVTGRKVRLLQDAPSVSAAEEKAPPRETGNSLAAQLARIRKQMEKE